MDPIWGSLGPFGAHLAITGPYLDLPGLYLDSLGPIWVSLGPIWASLGPTWISKALFGPPGSYLRPWALFGPWAWALEAEGRLIVGFGWRSPLGMQGGLGAVAPWVYILMKFVWLT